MNFARLSPLIYKVFLWLPICMGCWFVLADYLNYPAITLTGWVLQQFFPGWVEAMEWSNGLLTLVTGLEVTGVASPGYDQVAVMVVDVNPSIYTFGLPFFVALMLASNGRHKIHLLLLGCFLLVPFQTWGLSFDLLKQVAITAPASVIEQTAFVPYQREIIALGYQFGYLIMPTLTPVFLWLALNHQILSVQIQHAEQA